MAWLVLCLCRACHLHDSFYDCSLPLHVRKEPRVPNGTFSSVPLWHLQLSRPDSTYTSVMVISLRLAGLWRELPQCPLPSMHIKLSVFLVITAGVHLAEWRAKRAAFTFVYKNAYCLNVSFCLSQFGGKLISFGLTKAPGQQMQQPYPHQVFISQVTTETEFLLRSRELQMALQSGNLLDYCQSKIQTAKLPFDENLWNFLKVGWLWWNTEVSSFAVLGWNTFIMVLPSPLYFCSLRHEMELSRLVSYLSKEKFLQLRSWRLPYFPVGMVFSVDSFGLPVKVLNRIFSISAHCQAICAVLLLIFLTAKSKCTMGFPSPSVRTDCSPTQEDGFVHNLVIWRSLVMRSGRPSGRGRA